MRILIYTHAFAPQVGGVETYVMLLARGLTRSQQKERGEEVKVIVVTPTPAGEMDDAVLPFRVARRPGPATLLRLLRQADIVHLAGPSLLPMLIALAISQAGGGGASQLSGYLPERPADVRAQQDGLPGSLYAKALPQVPAMQQG